MKITLEQLKRLIREATEDVDRVKPYSAAELLKALEDAPDEAFDDEPKEEGEEEEEDVEDYHDPRPGDFARRRLEEGAIRLVYTNHGILTEERVRELKECGYGVDECGSWDVESPVVHMSHGMSDPSSKIILIRGDGLEEGDTSSPADGGGSVTGTQVALSMPNGPGGSPSPSGANVPNSSEPKSKPDVVVPPSMDMKKENYNRHVERLLEAWMEEEVEEELRGDQNELDVAPPFGELTGADFKNLGKKSSYKAKHEEKD
jgi:hypothetical protein